MMEADTLLIKNGLVLDPTNNFQGKTDLAIKDGRILGLGDFSQEKTNFMVDATDCLVTPGLIDHHAHVYPFLATGIPSESCCFSSGVTTVVDAGSLGCDTYEQHVEFLNEGTLLDIKAYLNISSTGLSTLPQLENMDPASFEEGKIRELFAKYPGKFEGLKLRTSKNIVGSYGLKPLEKTIQLAEKLQVPVMVHCTNPPEPLGEVIKMLRPGDILTHMYQNVGYTLLNNQGRVLEEAYRARERGVIFEAADARAHFSFEVSEQAIKEGFLPDIIATDLTQFSMFQRPTAFNLAMQISKYAYLGMDIYEVIKRCSQMPAQVMGLSGQIGCLSKGAWGDVAVFKKLTTGNEFGDRPYYESTKQLRQGQYVYKPMLTVKKGKLVYRDILF